MIFKIKIYTLFLLLLSAGITHAQTSADTAEIVNEFRKVMSFSTRPYVFFTTTTKMTAIPVVQEEDSMSFKGIFYKNQTGLYYSNGQEEVYLQDSLMIQINEKRKSIWISKVEINPEKKMSVLPAGNSQLLELFNKKYIARKAKVNDKIFILNLETRQKADHSTTITTNIKLQYLVKDYIPVLMETEIHMQQPLNDELLYELKNENIDAAKLVQTIGDVKYLVRSQNISVAFSEINNTKEQAMKMPSWKAVLDYQDAGQEFIAKGLYKNYEVTKTF